ncbi:hypothetical protein GTU79_21945 [Sodalis ligni]|uniref:hypothetical protein n=1 Tax=Sodalis ligni TaxID=2697027 RepID=UPI001BDF701F|nr:hypothetical protein [Sodalis ligni]QWA09935.1 hypothetical protein GTU79_21945 [Sodalis ligni]
MSDIRNAVITSAMRYLNEYLKVSQAAGRARIERFVSQRAPRYRPILKRMDETKLTIPPEISDKDLDLLLHKQLAELENDILSEGQEVMNFGKSESPDRYKARLSSYLEKVDDIKKSQSGRLCFPSKSGSQYFGKSDSTWTRWEIHQRRAGP